MEQWVCNAIGFRLVLIIHHLELGNLGQMTYLLRASVSLPEKKKPTEIVIPHEIFVRNYRNFFHLNALVVVIQALAFIVLCGIMHRELTQCLSRRKPSVNVS